MGLKSVFAALFGGRNHRPSEIEEEEDVELRSTVGGGDCGDEEPTMMKMSPHEQKRQVEQRRRKVTDLKKRLHQCQEQLDETLTDFKKLPGTEMGS